MSMSEGDANKKKLPLDGAVFMMDLYQIADELRATATLGLRYAENGYDNERYEHILQVAARLVAALENRPPGQIYNDFRGGLAHLSPIACVDTVVMRDGRILLIQRRDNQLWAMPGGLCEVGETLAQASARELWEEAGLRGRIVRLLGVFDSRRWHIRSKMQLFSAVFMAESDENPGLHPGNEALSPMAETLAVDFFAEDALPPLDPGHKDRVPFIFQLLRGEVDAPYFDRVD